MLFLVVDLSSNLWYNTLHNWPVDRLTSPTGQAPKWSRDTPSYGALARFCVPIMVHTARALVK